MKTKKDRRIPRAQVFSQILDCALAPDSRVILGDWEKRDIGINTPLKKVFDPISLLYLLNKIERCFRIKISDEEVFRSANMNGFPGLYLFSVNGKKESDDPWSFKTFLGLTNLVSKKLNYS